MFTHRPDRGGGPCIAGIARATIYKMRNVSSQIKSKAQNTKDVCPMAANRKRKENAYIGSDALPDTNNMRRISYPSLLY